MKIIDGHAHLVQTIAGFTAKGELRACGGGYASNGAGERIFMIPPQLGETTVTPEALLAVMDDCQVEKAVLLQGTYFGFQNDYTSEAVKKYPSRFIGAAAYDPFCAQKDAIRAHLFDELQFKILKLEVSGGCGLSSYHPDLNLDGEQMHEVYRDAARRGLTLVMDIGRPGMQCWQVDALAQAVRRYPEMHFVICHLTAPQLGDGEKLKYALDKLCLDNVWFDLAALCSNTRPEAYPYPTARRYVHDALNILGSERLIWGSDIPSTMTRDSYRHLIDYLALDPALSTEEKENIFYKNALKLYFENTLF
ncbi:MAG: amidohydrolase family protein [Lachnospiraceae bacterium]|nr:amidohydrolase family protein [Lachnospiraceae bacterium]